MKNSPKSALETIQRDLLAGDVPVTRILQKVILFSGQIGSTELRTWARRELDGYSNQADDLPEYRKVNAQILVDGQNGRALFKAASIAAQDLPEVAQKAGIGNEIRLGNGLAELEDLVGRDDFVRLGLPGGDMLAKIMTYERQQHEPFCAVERVYYSVSTAALRGAIEGARTALSDLVSELVRTLPSDRAEPTKEEADRAVGYVITGNLAPVTVNATTASGGAATVSTATATGSSTGTSTVTSARETSKPDSWWRRLRNKGIVITLFAIAGSTAGVLNWLHWYPFS